MADITFVFGIFHEIYEWMSSVGAKEPWDRGWLSLFMHEVIIYDYEQTASRPRHWRRKPAGLALAYLHFDYALFQIFKMQLQYHGYYTRIIMCS